MKLKHWSILLLLILFVVAMGYPDSNGLWFGFLQNGPDHVIDERLFWVFRLPELLICIVAGSCLAICGLLLQTFLNNPLAGPSILGLTSGSHLMVALASMATGSIAPVFADLTNTFAAAIGALVFSIFIILVSTRLRSRVSLLLVGMMSGTFVSALTSIIVTQADPAAVKAYTLWGYGTLSEVELSDFQLIIPVAVLGVVITLLLCKQLDALQLGERHATYLGVNYNQTKWILLIVVSILTGLVTSFCGPIGFVGLIVPNVVRMLYKTGNHRKLLFQCLIWGTIVLLLCDLIKLVLNPYIVLPINSLTSLMGAPIVISIILKQRKHAGI